MLNRYTGPDRRKHADDHDNLIEMIQIVRNHVNNFELHRKDFDEHKKEDTTSFNSLKKHIWMQMGAMGVIVFILELVFKK